MDEKLELRAMTVKRERGASEPTEGRLGPRLVKFDVGTHVGSFVMSNDRLGLTSQCNFGSLRINTCVFKGKTLFSKKGSL
jgi:Kip1 ubiquitination-promoting complex protein 1